MKKEAASSIVPPNNRPATTDHHGNNLNNSSNKPPKPLTIKTTASKPSCQQLPTTILPNSDSLKFPIKDLSPYSSPSLISPPSSAFVSALQSPYISPRALTPNPPAAPEEENPTQHAQPPSQPVSASYSSSQSEDIPSSSYTSHPEKSDFSDDGKPKSITCIPVQVPDAPAAPRISFSFPVPRISFAKGSVSPAVNAKLRSCDVYIGYHGQNANLVRFCKWLKSELEIQGIACFVADRAKYADNQSHEIADRVICSVTFGVVVVWGTSLFNHFSTEEIRFFAQKKNLIPIFFETEQSDVAGFLNHGADDKERREAIEGLLKHHHENKLETNGGDWRSCISRAASLLNAKLGRKSIAEKEQERAEELPFTRNRNFVGREKEMMEIESAFFGTADSQEPECPPPMIRGSTSGQSEGFADEESDMSSSTAGGQYISLEIATNAKSKGQNLDTWVEPDMVRNSSKRSRYKRSKSGKDRSSGSSMVCISGPPGVGKTEIALEFAHRFSHRYRMVLWLGGEAQHMRQNILNLSLKLGLDVSADPEKERGRIRSFEEQEFEAFKRVKRELFRDMPYLVIIDNLESEYEWWEGKDLHDLIPRNTGGSHVIITTRISKVMNSDPIQLVPLPSSEVMLLIRGRRKKDYPVEESGCLKKFDEKLGGSTFGLWVVGCLLAELAISPSALYDAVNGILLDEDPNSHSPFWSTADEQFWRNNYFLMKLLGFCFAVLEKANDRRNSLASRMLLVGAWFAPAPTSANLLATAANNMPAAKNQLRMWAKCLNVAFGLCSGCPLANQTWKIEEESAFLLVRLGLARKSTRQSEVYIQIHPITQVFARRREGPATAKAMILGVRKLGNSLMYSDHLWASAFLVFGYKTEPPLVQLKATDMVLYIKKTALPLAIRAFATYSRCSSALELLKVCTNVLEEVEKSFVSQIQDWCHGSLCWKKRLQSHTNQRVDEYVWQDVTLLKATMLETRAKLLLRGGLFDNAEELCRTCISIRTVMLGHNHAQTLAAQETLAKLVRLRSKI